MHPEIAKTLAEQRRSEITQYMAGRGRGRRGPAPRSGGLGRLLPRWHVSWSRTILSPAGGPPDTATGGYPDRPARRGSSLVIIISAHR
jgi:hypothetical protein